MLIRWGEVGDKQSWIELAREVAPVFQAPEMPDDPEFHAYIDAALSKYQALAAVDRMSGAVLGIVSFSRAKNRIAWFGVVEKHRGRGIGAKLLKCALNQLDRNSTVGVATFPEGYAPGEAARRLYKKFGFSDTDKALCDAHGNPRVEMTLPSSGEPRGGSFHYRFDEYASFAKPKNCPVCQGRKAGYPPVLIKEFEHAWLECYYEAQGCLFGKCHVLSKVHSEHFYDMPRADMADFMADVQKAARALHKVTGAVKINYEIHGNSMPHLHVHLFPRYLDDNFPSAPIDYRMEEPSPYESREEFTWFIERMRAECNEVDGQL